MLENCQEWLYNVKVSNDSIFIKLNEKLSWKENLILTGLANRLKLAKQISHAQNLINSNNKLGKIAVKRQCKHSIKISLKKVRLKLCQIRNKKYWETNNPLSWNTNCD